MHFKQNTTHLNFDNNKVIADLCQVILHGLASNVRINKHYNYWHKTLILHFYIILHVCYNMQVPVRNHLLYTDSINQRYFSFMYYTSFKYSLYF